MKNRIYISKFILIWVLLFSLDSCNPKIFIPKQNVSTIEKEEPNTTGNDIAPAQEKLMECIVHPQDSSHIINPVMASSKFVKKLFNSDIETADRVRKQVIENMTRNVESLYFTDTHSGFAAFAHPPAPEFLMGENLPFDKAANAGGTDIFYFAPNRDNQIKFKSFSKINSQFWDSHPTAITQLNSEGKCVTLLIFSSDRNNPFSKAINQNGDTIYGGSTDLFYTFGKFDPSTQTDTSDIIGYKFGEIYKLNGANTTEFNEGSPFVFCHCCNPTLFFSSNRNNISQQDFDIYALKLKIDFDNLTLETVGISELIDNKSIKTDSLTFSINTIADERFPFVPYPHIAKDSNSIYFSSDRNRKPEPKPCNCEDGRDRTENIGGYDIYKFKLPEKYNCPKPKEPEKPIIYEPELYAEIVIVNAANPKDEVKNSQIRLIAENGNEIIASSDSSRIYTKIDFDKKYSVTGGSTFSSMDCESSTDIIFRGYIAPSEKINQLGRDSSSRIEVLTGYTMNAKDFLKINKDSIRLEAGKIFVKGIECESDDKINEKIINARIENDIVYYDKQFIYTKYWNKLDIRPDLGYAGLSNSADMVHQIGVRSVRTMNENLHSQKPKSNERIILRDTVYLLPDYIVKPPCYCEFSGVLTTYQQNVPYFLTGFWEVNTLKNYRRDIPRLESGKFSEAKWIELHKNNQYFGEGMFGRNARFNEYENYARTVDTNLSKMADMIINNIIPAFKIIDSISPGGKLVISLDAWSDRRPVRRGWYIGDEVSYIEGSLNENKSAYDIDFHKVNIPDKSSLNENNDTLSRLRAFYGYKELLTKLLDTAKFGTAFYDYYKSNLVLLPDNESLKDINLNQPFSVKAVEELIYKSKIIILAKGNYFDPTEYKIPKYIKDVDSSLFMLDTIRRIDVRINTLQYQAGKLIKSPCCNQQLPCVDYGKILDLQRLQPAVTDTKKKKLKK
jgi:hypothetical protein